jgi:hypothetical protein
MKIYLKYIGLGSYIPDVPARDLTKEEAEYHGIGRLLDSHLYEVFDGYVDDDAKKVLKQVEKKSKKDVSDG